MKIVSACLSGVKCRYNGTSSPCKAITELVNSGEAIPICPERLAGLPTPRPCTEKLGDRIVAENGEDFTESYVKGAQVVLEIATLVGCREAILKSGSPSCGSKRIYDGTFTGKMRQGDGVLASLLKEHGIEVLTEGEI